MTLLAERNCALSEAGLALASHRLRARLVPAGRRGKARKQPLALFLLYLSVALSLFLISLHAGPHPAAAPGTAPAPLAQQLRAGRFAITVPFLDSLTSAAAALSKKLLRPEAGR